MFTYFRIFLTRYGSDWTEYKKRVPFVFFPFALGTASAVGVAVASVAIYTAWPHLIAAVML